MIGEEADEAGSDDETAELNPVPGRFRQLVDQKPDPDHLAVAEGVGEAEERHRRHAPGHEIVGGRNVKITGRPADSSIIWTKIATMNAPAR